MSESRVRLAKFGSMSRMGMTGTALENVSFACVAAATGS
jgi:hypothetical protein